MRGQAAIESATPTARRQKGQAAIEYVVTYGWAIVILLVALTILYGLGILNPGRYLPQECSFPPNLDCNYYRLERVAQDNYKLTIGLTNGLGFNIKLKDATLTSEGSLSSGQDNGYEWQTTPSIAPAIFPSEPINDGGSVNLIVQFASGTSSIGTLERMKVTVTYYNCGAVDCTAIVADTPTHVVSGRINANVEPGG